MKVVLLCGGKGTRIREETENRPKPMIKIGEKPILWHIMNSYSFYGFNDFILCTGYKADVIREYFFNYAMHNSDFTMNLKSGECEFYGRGQSPDWRVTLVDTGENTMTGGRVKRIERYIEDDNFFLTYGDGVTDLNIKRTLEFHQSHGKIGTVIGVAPPSQYGVLHIEKNHVLSFHEKPEIHQGNINGGYFVFSKKIFKYLSDDENCILERTPLEKLAQDRELCVYNHPGFWQCMDTYRDYLFLQELWKSGKAPWNSDI